MYPSLSLSQPTQPARGTQGPADGRAVRVSPLAPARQDARQHCKWCAGEPMSFICLVSKLFIFYVLMKFLLNFICAARCERCVRARAGDGDVAE